MGATHPLGRIGGRHGRPWLVAEPAPASGAKPRLLAQLHEAIRVRHLSPRTAEAYRIRPVRERPGQEEVSARTTWPHVLNRGPAGVRGPVDGLLDTPGG